VWHKLRLESEKKEIHYRIMLCSGLSFQNPTYFLAAFVYFARLYVNGELEKCNQQN
jgi:hypothetical protein